MFSVGIFLMSLKMDSKLLFTDYFNVNILPLQCSKLFCFKLTYDWWFTYILVFFIPL